jgi:hypothetical protein
MTGEGVTAVAIKDKLIVMLPTNKLTPWTRDLLEKVTISQQVHYRTQNGLPTLPILSQTNTAHALPVIIVNLLTYSLHTAQSFLRS